MLNSPTKIIIIATLLLVTGAALPFLILIKLLPSTFFLNFLAYGCSVLGLVLGFYGISGMVIGRNQKDDWEDWRDL